MASEKTVDILLVEDNPADARLVEALLGPFRAAYRLTTVARLNDALEALGRHEFALVLLDLNLPDGTGMDLVRRVVTGAPRTAVVVLSGQADEGLALQAMGEGCQDYLFKGLMDEDMLRRAIRHSVARKEIENRWRDAERRLRVLSRATESSPAAVIITSRDGKIEYVNPRFCAMTGYAASEVLGQNPRILKSGRKSPEEYRILWDAILGGSSWQGEMENRRKDGSHYWALAAIAPIQDEKGDITHFVAVQEDISEVREAREAMRLAKEAAEEANQAKSEFLSSMSHELRTPLNAILGFAQMLEFNPREPLTEAQKRAVDHILSGGRHLLSLINEILELSRIEAGKLPLNIEEFDAAGLIAECLSLSAPLGVPRGIAIDQESGNCSARLRADPIRVKQILLNLLSNAVKYNRDGGRVTVRCRGSRPGVQRVEVEDTGHGIPPDRLGELFQPFSRLGAEATAVEGTGVGLALSRKLAKVMDGDMGVESVSGQGSRFWVELPATEAVASATQREGKASKAAPDAAGLVLYVEDNPTNQALMEQIVERMPGVTLLLASDAVKGLALAATAKPDLILMDISLPGMDGYQALAYLKESDATSTIPIVALSANAMASDIERGLAAGFRRYLTKPIRVGEVMAVIAEFLGGAKR